MSRMNPRISLAVAQRLLVPLIAALLVAGCAGPAGRTSTLTLPEPLVLSPPPAEATTAPPEKAPRATRFLPSPTPPVAAAPAVDGVLEPRPIFGLEQEDLVAAISIDSLSLPAFINEIYGNILRLTFQIDPELAGRKDLVTLRAAEAQAPEQLDALARKVLASYGVAIRRDGEMLHFVPEAKAAGPGALPLLTSGRTLPEVPLDHRPVFHLVPLHVVRNTQVMLWLRSAYNDPKLQIFEDAERNAILLLGPPALVRQGVEAAILFDQPAMKGRHSLRIDPAFIDAESLAQMLVDVLNSEGVAASLKPPLGSLHILPLRTINTVLVFAAAPEILAHVRQWAVTLDQPSEGVAHDSFFYYQVQETSAAEMVKSLEGMLGSALQGGGLAGPVPVPALPAGTAAPAAGAAGSARSGARARAADNKNAMASSSGASRRLAVDESRNSIIFYGASEEWRAIRALLQEMDKPPRQVLIEVTVAEITLADSLDLGLEWMLKGVGLGHLSGKVATLSGLGVGSQGLLYTLDNAGDTRLLLNAFATRNLVNILSSPKVMVKSGKEATIDVGTEVPLVVSQSSSSDMTTDGDSSILQEIQYRKTGVLLKVKPVVHSGNRVDLELSQEVSEATANTTSSVNSPSIFSRKINTTLSLEDGGSILIGGLISSSKSKIRNSVPLLGELPLLGPLFRVDSDSDSRTELMVLIVPYVIDNGQRAREVSRELRGRFEGIETP